MDAGVRHGVPQLPVPRRPQRLKFGFTPSSPVPVSYGVATTGTLWRFLRLDSPDLTVDAVEHPIGDPGRTLGILAHIVQSA